MRAKLSQIFGVILSLALTTAAHAGVLTFEELPHAYELEGVGDVIFSNGFVLRYAPAPGEPYPTSFMSVGPSWPYNGRSTAVLANSCSATTTLTAEDNNPITLESIDVAGSNGDREVTVAFEGITAEGEVVRKSVKLKNAQRWQTVELPKRFRNLRSVRWEQGDCVENFPHMFDNINVVPTWREKPLK